MKPRIVLITMLMLGFWACNNDKGEAQFQLENAFPNLTFDNPVDLQHPGDGTDRVFIVEQRGVIKVFGNSPAVTSAKVFLDIQDRVDYGGEKGLLGLAFHPDYENNGYFFVDYTAPNPLRTIIARYHVNPNDPNQADKDSETILLEINQPYTNHNGGQIVFGPDGYLYIAMGDGGSAGDPQGNAQNLRSLLGKLLRIDVNNPAGGKLYGIPSDNPFVNNTSGYREEIYTYGLRNPWRFSFDPVTGRLWLADVGQNRIEEIDLIEKGKNYGWNVMEGSQCYKPSTGCDTTGLVKPVWEYDHSLGCSITGGFVYRGPGVPQLLGHYIYADYCSGRIWALQYDGVSRPANTELIDTNLNISSFGVAANNELYICDHSGGKIYRFKPTTTGVKQGNLVPLSLRFGHSFPNPFNTSTALKFKLTAEEDVELSIFDVTGKVIRSLVQRAMPVGEHVIHWDGKDDEGIPQPSGVYLYRLRLGNEVVAASRVVLVR